MSAPEDRAAYIAGMRRLMDILEASPDLPLPEQHHRQPVTWWLTLGTPQQVAALEAALGVTLAGSIDEDVTYYNLDGDLDGMKVRVKAWATKVAERRVTGTRTVEDVEWVRLPAEDPAGSADEDEEPQP